MYDVSDNQLEAKGETVDYKINYLKTYIIWRSFALTEFWVGKSDSQIWVRKSQLLLLELAESGFKGAILDF